MAMALSPAKAGGILPLLRSAALPVAILLLVVLMVVPIPAAMLDMFFIMNITISLAVLMVSLNAQKPLDFSAFPTVLAVRDAVPALAQRRLDASRAGPRA